VNRFLDQRLHMRQLRLIRALSQNGSLSAAARALHVTQPALTKSLHELERVVGEPLFERSAKGVRPTTFGWALVRFADRTLADLDRLDDELSRMAAPGEGLVVLGSLPVSAAGLMPRVVRALRQEHPALEIRMVVGRTEDMLPRLESGELDLVLGQLYPPEVPDGMVREVLYDEPISVIARAGHPLFEKPNLSTADLMGCDFVLPTFGQRLGRDIEHLVDALGLAASPRLLRSSSHLFIREVLHETDMVAVAPWMLMASDLVRGSLRVAPVIKAAPLRPAGLILNPQRRLSPSAELLIDAVRRGAAELAEAGISITAGYGPGGKSNDVCG
jgi:LysR family transcriptional regulator, pca operon transcriptional activator